MYFPRPEALLGVNVYSPVETLLGGRVHHSCCRELKLLVSGYCWRSRLLEQLFSMCAQDRFVTVAVSPTVVAQLAYFGPYCKLTTLPLVLLLLLMSGF